MTTISEYRKEKKLTLVKFAELVGVTHATVSKWERGHLVPSARLMRKIMDVTGGAVTPNDFFESEPAKTA